MARLPNLNPRMAIVVAAISLVAAAALVVVIALSLRDPASVETQGTLHPPAGTAPRGTAGTAPTSTATTAVTPEPSTTAPPVVPTPPPTRPPVPSTSAPPPPAPDEPEPTPPPPAADPFHLRIDRIGVDAPILPVGVEPGTNAMEIPGLDEVGWYRFGSLPGDAAGTAVLVGHVDGDGRPGVFAALRDLEPGDALTVTLPDGTERAFAVTGRQQFDKQALPSDLFTRGGPPRLALITCGGPFDAATGHYVDNVVIVAAAT